MTIDDDLIARLEAARIGNVELSAEIARDVMGMMPHEPSGWPFWFRGRNGTSVTPCPAYTTSIDAALELVPRNKDASFHMMYDEAGGSHVLIKVSGSTWGEAHLSRGSLALALCIAALRARRDR